MGLVIIAIILALSIPVSIYVVSWFSNQNAKAFLDHISQNQVVGGQPKDIAKLQLDWNQEEKTKQAEFIRARKQPTAADVLS